MTANETGNAPDFHAMINTSAGNKSHHDGAIAARTYPPIATTVKVINADFLPNRSANQPPGYWKTPSSRSFVDPKRPTTKAEAPSATRYFGKKASQRSSPRASTSVLAARIPTFRFNPR